MQPITESEGACQSKKRWHDVDFVSIKWFDPAQPISYGSPISQKDPKGSMESMELCHRNQSAKWIQIARDRQSGDPQSA